MNQRIKDLRKSLGLTLEEFGRRIGIGKSAASKIENGRNGATDQTIRSICREFHVREEWLRNGTGDMYEEGKKPDDEVDAILKANNVTGVEAEFIKLYVSLPAELRVQVIRKFEEYFAKKKASDKPPDGPPGEGEPNHDD